MTLISLYEDPEVFSVTDIDGEPVDPEDIKEVVETVNAQLGEVIFKVRERTVLEAGVAAHLVEILVNDDNIHLTQPLVDDAHKFMDEIFEDNDWDLNPDVEYDPDFDDDEEGEGENDDDEDDWDED